jgi:hypothetical protein
MDPSLQVREDLLDQVRGMRGIGLILRDAIPRIQHHCHQRSHVPRLDEYIKDRNQVGITGEVRSIVNQHYRVLNVGIVSRRQINVVVATPSERMGHHPDFGDYAPIDRRRGGDVPSRPIIRTGQD